MSSVSIITLQRIGLPYVRVDPLALEKYVQAQGGMNKIKESCIHNQPDLTQPFWIPVQFRACVLLACFRTYGQFDCVLLVWLVVACRYLNDANVAIGIKLKKPGRCSSEPTLLSLLSHLCF